VCCSVLIGVVEQVELKHASLVGVVRGLLHVDKHSRLSAVTLRTLLLSIQKEAIQQMKLVCTHAHTRTPLTRTHNHIHSLSLSLSLSCCLLLSLLLSLSHTRKQY